MTDFKAELKELILKSLRITDITPEEFEDDEPLMDGEIEIDSIDILQLITDIEKKYGIRLVEGKFDRSIWENVNALSAAIQIKIEEAAGK